MAFHVKFPSRTEWQLDQVGRDSRKGWGGWPFATA